MVFARELVRFFSRQQTKFGLCFYFSTVNLFFHSVVTTSLEQPVNVDFSHTLVLKMKSERTVIYRLPHTRSYINESFFLCFLQCYSWQYVHRLSFYVFSYMHFSSQNSQQSSTFAQRLLQKDQKLFQLILQLLASKQKQPRYYFILLRLICSLFENVFCNANLV